MILEFIQELADYEQFGGEVTATTDLLKESLFERKMAEVIIGEYQGQPVAFALFFHNFSTFLGKPGLYLEDLYVRPELRKWGIGGIILAFLAKLALKRHCSRLEWWCLDWNDLSIRFYRNLSAIPMNDWTVYRLCDRALEEVTARLNLKIW